MQRLFVYGTLAPGRPNEHVLADIDGTWEPASVRGRLMEAGWGFEHGYPALALDADAPEVRGFLFSAEHLAEHWPRLDEFEGIGYDRVGVRAQRSDGTTIDAQVYVNNPTA